ncbi:hypothetical protein R3I93_006162 [Phoxinus phoxinus]|uniref:RNase H type-1 domain-containing protein n=1 Tax=Phoxinus phoxinus TaxID=58324 RepID=A0AAN9DD13_9TELE
MVQGTAQYAELMAAFQALTALQKMGILQAILVTDSSYVATGINDNLHIWKENGYNKSKEIKRPTTSKDQPADSCQVGDFVWIRNNALT